MLPAGWVRTDLVPLSPPQLAGGHLVLYVEGDGGIEVVGLDPKTGKTAWHDDASPGATAPGVEPALGVAGSTVAILRAVDNTMRSSQVVGIDATDGRPLWHTPTGTFEDWPAPCPDSSSEICTDGSLGNVSQTLALRFRASDGTQVGAVTISQAVGGRRIGPDLYDPGVRDPEAIVAVSGTSVAWTQLLSSVFSLPGDSSDWGWNIAQVRAVGLFVGSVGGPPLNVTATTGSLSIARAMTAGFRISDGSEVWRDPGTVFECSLLPCPGQGMDFTGDPTMGLRLRVTGTVTSTLSSGAVSLSPGGDVSIEGFDLATGKTLWSYNAGSDINLAVGMPPVIGSEVVALPANKAGGKPIALNLATGKSAPVAPDTPGWCASGVSYTTQVHYPTAAGGTTNQRTAASGFKPCDAAGDDLSHPSTVPSFAGVTVDGLTVTSDSSEVAASPSGV
jgi:outer membrane protein assembly factor BamB